MFNAELEYGIATAHADGKYIDAAAVGNTAGLEFSVDKMRMSDASRQSRRADAVVTVDCTPQVLLQMAMVILDKLDLPAFTNSEWLTVANALRYTATATSDNHLVVMAEQIEASVGKIEAL